ncbi:MAG TPA: sialidase family protein [Planctomycetaceae bacterium]|nr:sialidase family protein [Planctomycetaceae bacterium]
MLRVFFCLSIVAICFSSVVSGAEVDVFVSGEDAYHTFRIPAVIRTPKGTLIAFCEGRKTGRGDSGNIDLVYKRSFDDGKTWSPLAVLWDDGENTCGNPCPVIDESSGDIVLPLTWNHGDDREDTIKQRSGKDTRRVYLSRSSDDGGSWRAPQEITSQTKRPDWTWYATGPGIGIQLKRGPHRGRLVVPCDHNLLVEGVSVRRSHCLYSDDGGVSWNLGEPLESETNECQVAELSDGSLLLNMRSYHGKNLRAVAGSKDGGETWSGVTLDPELIEPVCQASLISLADGRLAFAHPASTKRERMTIRLSSDEGKSWPISKLIHEASAAYSCLVELSERELGLLYERDDYKRIVFARIEIGGR